jgi:hypothetical protein
MAFVAVPIAGRSRRATAAPVSAEGVSAVPAVWPPVDDPPDDDPLRLPTLLTPDVELPPVTLPCTTPTDDPLVEMELDDEDEPLTDDPPANDELLPVVCANAGPATASTPTVANARKRSRI